MLHEVEGDLFKSSEKYIVHQCNCITTRAAHLAYHMFKRFPYSDVYTPRNGLGDKLHADLLMGNMDEPPTPQTMEMIRQEDVPGEILIRGNGDDQRYVIAILGQYYPGFVRYADSEKDGVKARQRYFRSGLRQIAKIPSLESIAFPYKIACGAAGGDWDIYYKMLKDFSENSVPEAEVYIYRLPGME